MVEVVLTDGTKLQTSEYDGLALLELIAERQNGLNNVRIKNATFEGIGLAELLVNNVQFINCTFQDVNFTTVNEFRDVSLQNCTIIGFDKWTNRTDIKLIDCKVNVPPTNEELEKIVRGKVFSLPNKDYVKVETECDFCHNKFYDVMARKNAKPMLKQVPQCDKRVCDQCYKNYDLTSKIKGNRTYGWRGSLSFYRTPMDAKNTEILGLEMEFEGNFWNWKGLQDAHRGHLHYGYDSSVKGENELSWDCGSYSYWKYLAPLEDVCKAVQEGGGKPGDTAGIHIHVSTPDSNVEHITATINTMCCRNVFKTMMEAVSLRTNKERFDMYANLSKPIGAHHAGISYNSHNTCEFRVFNSCLNPKIILRHLKFCKEFYHLVKEGTPQDRILASFSKETKKHIAACAKTQAETGFISEKNANNLIKALGV